MLAAAFVSPARAARPGRVQAHRAGHAGLHHGGRVHAPGGAARGRRAGRTAGQGESNQHPTIVLILF